MVAISLVVALAVAQEPASADVPLPDAVPLGTADFTPYRLSISFEATSAESLGLSARYALIDHFTAGVTAWRVPDAIGDRRHNGRGFRLALGAEAHPFGNGLKGPWAGGGVELQRASGSPDYDFRADIWDAKVLAGQRWMYHPGISFGVYGGLSTRLSYGNTTAGLVGLDVGFAPVLDGPQPRPGYRARDKGWLPEKSVVAIAGSTVGVLALGYVGLLLAFQPENY